MEINIQINLIRHLLHALKSDVSTTEFSYLTADKRICSKIAKCLFYNKSKYCYQARPDEKGFITTKNRLLSSLLCKKHTFKIRKGKGLFLN